MNRMKFKKYVNFCRYAFVTYLLTYLPMVLDRICRSIYITFPHKITFSESFDLFFNVEDFYMF